MGKENKPGHSYRIIPEAVSKVAVSGISSVLSHMAERAERKYGEGSSQKTLLEVLRAILKQKTK